MSGLLRLALEAAWLLPRAAFAVQRQAFRRAVAFGTVPLGDPQPVNVPDLGRAVAGVARRAPFRALCFEQGLTVQRMLRRRGLPAVLHYGIGAGAPPRAHVWVSLDGDIVHGGELAPQFQEVGQWP